VDFAQCQFPWNHTYQKSVEQCNKYLCTFYIILSIKSRDFFKVYSIMCIGLFKHYTVFIKDLGICRFYCLQGVLEPILIYAHGNSIWLSGDSYGRENSLQSTRK
jgi:hypothetical protein